MHTSETLGTASIFQYGVLLAHAILMTSIAYQLSGCVMRQGTDMLDVPTNVNCQRTPPLQSMLT